MKVRLVSLLILLFAASIQAAPLRVGFVYVGSANDGGWSQKHDEGRLYLEKVFGREIETGYAENVVEGEQDLEIMRSFAEHGFDIVFSTSFGFMDDVVEIAEIVMNFKE